MAPATSHQAGRTGLCGAPYSGRATHPGAGIPAARATEVALLASRTMTQRKGFVGGLTVIAAGQTKRIPSPTRRNARPWPALIDQDNGHARFAPCHSPAHPT